LSASLLASLLAFVYLLNVPFGYWRADTKRFSKQWIMAIHLPVPLIFALRFMSGVDPVLIPLFVVAFFLGQLTGGRIKLHRKKAGARPISSCLVMDLARVAARRLA